MFNHTSSPNTRELILDFLSRRAACCDDLSLALHLTKPDIQYHLTALLSKGLIKEKKVKTFNAVRGRPKKYYQSADSNPNDLSQDLHKIFLLLLQHPHVDNNSMLQQISKSLFGETLTTNNYLAAIQHLIKVLSDHHYQPHWEIRSAGIVINLNNCPFRSFIENTDLFCKLDELTLEKHTGLAVIKTYCQRIKSDHFCQFVLTSK